ncbi:5-methyltetrahydropteroyltriglutamate--homocysteine S-methyltransferase [Gynurincola endophyticus]|uniref:5-methyltetrahydropteroyltriglutamate-- homocysteine S-methyltransferase n=1 Tax=Gynurincola endophyticus TaxID=2479004 RepID=UPI000F8E35A8|nr:5-methyltetrahydropteroyltriglutamate--homocysteine S-methyltransferase [Gynurincola endophyticus]
MRTHNLGYPRIGNHRELKKACESYWANKITQSELLATAKQIRLNNWQLQNEEGIELIPVNDFTFYDHVLDTSLMVGAIPPRYAPLLQKTSLNEIDWMFAMARGYQKDGLDLTAMEMTKWFDTNYHYIVPEFTAGQTFSLFSEKIIRHFEESKEAGINGKPVIVGPFSFLYLGKEKDKGFNRLSLIDQLLPVYVQVLEKLRTAGAEFIQFDEPCLTLDLTHEELQLFKKVYHTLKIATPQLHFILAAYFDGYGKNLSTVLELPVDTLHLDLVKCPEQLDHLIENRLNDSPLRFSLGIVDGRNIWKNDFEQSLQLIKKAQKAFGNDRLWIAPSCSLLHVPCDLSLETNEEALPATIKNWMSFAKQKLQELSLLADLAGDRPKQATLSAYGNNKAAIYSKQHSDLIHQTHVKARVQALQASDATRNQSFEYRKQQQQLVLQLPDFPTTTIGSFPQTKEIRAWRAQHKKGVLSDTTYDTLIKEEITKAIRWQEETGIDVLVHGEFERNDMVEYFGEQLNGFVFTANGWVQSYGSRCVKPPVIFGDVQRVAPMTVAYTSYAQSLTQQPVKGMLTGPVTILNWSFVRNDQPRAVTCLQIALAIRDEVKDLENAGINIIQIDEPALREGLPLKQSERESYLNWSVNAFKVASSGVKDATQIHTHMCYCEFNDIMPAIAALDADVITIETSRSQMELLDAFVEFKYPNDIGPGVYDIHSPRVPAKEEMIQLIEKTLAFLPADRVWINPDCGLKTRGWEETKPALTSMVDAARELRIKHPATVNQ